MTDYVSEYIEKIESGEITVSKKVRSFYLNVVKPIVEDTLSGRNELKYVYKQKPGYAFVKIVENFCKQSKGAWAGKNMKLCLFQKAKWQAFLGIKDRKTNKRRFREIFDVRGRKNGKSTENAAVGLYMLMTEPGAEIYAAATVKSQARRIWDESQSMIDQEPYLSDIFGYKVFPSPTIYTKGKIKSVYKVLSKNVKTFDGLNASGAIIDEMHELPRAIYDVLKQSMTTREEPILSGITTAGFVRGALFDDEYKYATQVIDSADPNTGETLDDTLMPLIYELDDPEEIEDEAMWIKANPGIDVIKNRIDLRANVKRMRNDLNFTNSVKTKDFNIIGVSSTAWLSGEDIMKAMLGPYTKEEIGEDENDPKRSEFLSRFDGSLMLAGFDLSEAGDMTAFTYVLFDQEKQCAIFMPMAWVTKKFLNSPVAKASRVPWDAWLERGIIRIGGDELNDYTLVRKYTIELMEKHGYSYGKIGYDPYNASYLASDLAAAGFEPGVILQKVRQGFITLGEPMRVFKEMLGARQITCLGNPLMIWALSNVEMVSDRNGNMMPKKMADNGMNKIDPFAAGLDAFVEFVANRNSYLPSFS